MGLAVGGGGGSAGGTTKAVTRLAVVDQDQNSNQPFFLKVKIL